MAIFSKGYYPLLLFLVSFIFVTLFSRATSFLYYYEGFDAAIFKQMGLAFLRGKTLYVDYFDNILVYSEKVRQADDFNRQHRYWMLSQVQAIFRNARYLPIALLNRQYNLVDKLLQWLLIPRMALVLVIVFMGIITPFIYFTIALKWWALFSIVLFDFALATPNYLVDDKWDSTFFKLPFVLFNNLLNRFKLGRIIEEKVNLKS